MTDEDDKPDKPDWIKRIEAFENEAGIEPDDDPNPTMFYFKAESSHPFRIYADGRLKFGFGGFGGFTGKRPESPPCTDPGGHLWEERQYTLLVVGGGEVSDCVHCGATTTRFGTPPEPRRWRDPK